MLLVINPAPTNSAHDRAISPTTSTLLSLPAWKLEDPLASSLSTLLTSVCDIWNAGAAPANTAVNAVTATTNARIGTSTANSM